MNSQSAEDMTNRYTQAEWRSIIDEAEKEHSSTTVRYKAPVIGSLEFAKCIDHTLLKLEVTPGQIDQLCDEAVQHNFKVGVGDIASSLCEAIQKIIFTLLPSAFFPFFVKIG